MRHTIPLLFLCFFLSGCYSDQKQQLASCQIIDNKENGKSDVNASPDAGLIISAQGIELCMESHGYEETAAHCREYSYKLKAPISEVASSNYLVAISPKCYEPMGWSSRRVFDLERLLGQVD